jgi:signal transduction histidine kinase
MEIDKKHIGVQKITDTIKRNGYILLFGLVISVFIEYIYGGFFGVTVFFIFMVALIYYTIVTVNNMLVEEFNIVVRKEKDLLSYKLSNVFSQNIDHQLKTPLLALQQGFKKNYIIIKILSSYAKPNGKRDFDRIIFGCNDKTKDCATCYLQGTAYCTTKKRLLEDIIDNQKVINEAVSNMFKTLNLLKVNKKRRAVIEDVNVYELFYSAFRMYKMLNKYNFEYNISEKLRDIRLLNITNEEMFNVINNHIQNSLEAHSTIIRIETKIVKDWVYIFIVDNGQGIPKDVDINNIWRIGASSKGSGRGFGMFLCREIIEHANGDIKIISTGKKGTTILIKLKYELLKEKK